MDSGFHAAAEQAVPLHAEVTQAIQRASRWPGFSRVLEKRFEADTDQARISHLVRAGLVMMLVGNCFIATDWLVLPDVLGASLAVHVACSLVYYVVLLMTQRGRLPASVREALHGLMILIALVGALALFCASHAPDSPYDTTTYMLFLIAVTIVLRLRFVWASVFGGLCLLAIVGVLLLRHDIPPGVRLLLIMATTSAGAFTLYANYAIEMNQRIAYLLTLERQLEAQALQQSNAVLSALSATDWLTGVGNRRAFDAQLAQAWSRAVASGAEAGFGSLALIMIDVDHFKSYNDRYGHPAGDACLCSLVAMMREQLRAGQDVLARYGGEEFAVILPFADLDHATAAAERLRRAVEDLALPHGGTGAGDFVTISVGVATAAPALQGTREALIEAADRALYRAKRGGRNLVFVA